MLKNSIIEAFTNDGHRYSKNEAGEDIFYPWFYPGEAFLVPSEIKSRLILKDSLTLLALFLALGSACYFEHLGLISVDVLGIVLGVIADIYFFILLLIALSCKAECKPFLLPVTSRPRKGIILGWLILLLPIQSIWLIFSSGETSQPLMILVLLLVSISTLFIAYMFIQIMRARGYVFEKSGLFSS